MIYLDLFLFILVVFSFLCLIIKDTNSINDSFYLKEYKDFTNLLNQCDLQENIECYKKYKNKYEYIVFINNTLVFNNCLSKKPKFQIKRIYYNKIVKIIACQ